jgi:DNA-binding MarR family transcriptional regulator
MGYGWRVAGIPDKHPYDIGVTLSLDVTKIVWASDYAKKASTQLVLLALADRANEKGFCYPGVRDITQRTRLSERTIRYVITELERDKVVKVERSRGRRSNRYFLNLQRLQCWRDETPQLSQGIHHYEQGTPENKSILTVQPLQVTPEPAAAELSSNLHEEKSHNNPPRANGGGRSKFSLDVCSDYAKHLHQTGRGIKNPEGFARSILRSGEQDDLIQAFLNHAKTEVIDIKECPKCLGIGFYYPRGIGNDGVLQCKHEGLLASPRNT